MRIRSKQVLLDASVIITAHEIDVWNALLREVDVAVTSIIAHDESLFFSKEAGLVPAPINITVLIQQGAIPELSASVSDIERVRAVFDEELNMALHDGEVEAIALLYADQSDSLLFCTSDKVAIRVLAMLGLSDSGVSFEETSAPRVPQRVLRPIYRRGANRSHSRERSPVRLTVGWREPAHALGNSMGANLILGYSCLSRWNGRQVPAQAERNCGMRPRDSRREKSALCNRISIMGEGMV